MVYLDIALSSGQYVDVMTWLDLSLFSGKYGNVMLVLLDVFGCVKVFLLVSAGVAQLVLRDWRVVLALLLCVVSELWSEGSH